MKLSDGIKQAYNRQWSMINTFTVQFAMPPGLVGEIGEFTDDINLNIVSITTPDFTNDPIETFVANKWRIHNGKDSLYRFTMTFRDQNQMDLYRTFMKMYEYTRSNYFDDCAMTVVVTKDADWGNETDKLFSVYSGVLVEAVSNVSFDNNTENQIAEFTVSFKCNEVNLGF